MRSAIYPYSYYYVGASRLSKQCKERTGKVQANSHCVGKDTKCAEERRSEKRWN